MDWVTDRIRLLNETIEVNQRLIEHAKYDQDFEKLEELEKEQVNIKKYINILKLKVF